MARLPCDLSHCTLRLGQPEDHIHGAVEADRDGELEARLFLLTEDCDSPGLRDGVDEGEPLLLLHHLEPTCQGRADRLGVEDRTVAIEVKAPG